MMSGASYFIDGLAPFRRYLSLSEGTAGDKDEGNAGVHCAENDDGVSDWGIDTHDFRSFSSPTLVNDHMHVSVDLSGDTPHVGSVDFWGMSPDKKHQQQQPPHIRRRWTVPDLRDKLQRRHNNVESESEEFMEEFRYVLVTSQLLDETILVSRFYKNGKKSSHFQLGDKRVFYNKFGKVVRLGSQYRITSKVNNGLVIREALRLNSVKNLTDHSHYELEQMIIRALSAVHLHVRSKAIFSQLIHSAALAKLKLFIKTSQKFDVPVQKLISKYKEMKLYGNLIPTMQTEEHNVPNPDVIYDMVNSVLTLALQGSIKSLNSLLLFVNGDEFENYCGIYNIELPELMLMLDGHHSHEMSISSLVDLLKRFRYVRRFLICTLLALDFTQSSKSGFLKKVGNMFKLDVMKPYTTTMKWESVTMVLDNEQSLVNTLTASINSFILLNGLKFGSTPTSTLLKAAPKVKQQDPTAKLSRMVKDLQMHILSIDKTSSRDAQLENFKSLQADLDSLMQQYQKDLTKLESSTVQRPFHLNKQRVTSTTRKRFSLPTSQHLKYVASPDGSRSASSSPTNHKRLSSGLGLPLLTVSESHDEGDANDYINNMLSNDDSVLITSSTDDKSFEILDNNLLREQLERNFSRLTSTSTVIGPQAIERDDETSKNDDQVDEYLGNSLLDEMKLAMAHRDSD